MPIPKMIPRHPHATLEHAGEIPFWLNTDNPKSAQEQLDEGYAFGGFRPFEGFRLLPDDSLSYPGDPPTQPIAEWHIRDERIVLYTSAWVAVIQPDRSFVVARMD